MFGLLLLEFNDSIKEGDGERLLDVYKVALVLYKEYGKSKYAYEVLLFLVKIYGKLSKHDAHNLKWNRFFNKHGTKGGNIPLDLRMEQLNKIVKTMWRFLGANLNESSAARVANTVDEMEQILDRVDEDCDISSEAGYRSKGKPEDAVSQITKDLNTIKAFKYTKGRKGHPTFETFPRTLVRKLNYRELHSWMTNHIKTWDTIYVNNTASS